MTMHISHISQSQLLIAAVAAAWFGAALAADKPLGIIGRLSSAGIDDEQIFGEGEEDTNFARGGWVQVNGVPVTVPKYLQIAFPATFVPFADFFGQVNDFIGYDIEVVGNYVEDRLFEPIAGQIIITQANLMAGQGVIATIDTVTGDITLEEGTVLRIVDPSGAYSPPTTQHELFTADPENPSISAFSGFPMCVKSVNTAEWCLDANRPTDAQRTNFVAPEPLGACPFAVGDSLDYSGMEADGKVWVYSITVNSLNLLTRDSDAPYLRIEDGIIGVFNLDPNTESANDRFVGFLSNSNSNNLPVQIKGIKPGICTGKPSYVDLGLVTELLGARIKFDWRDRPTGPMTYFREYYLRGAKAPVPWKTETNSKPKITLGQYIMPVSEWIQAELTTPGLLPPRNDFSNMYHLTTGLGWDGEKIWRSLDPFPQSGVQLPPQPTWDECVTAREAEGSDPDTPPTDPQDPVCPTTADTVTFNAAATDWQSTGRGTLIVQCQSSVVDDALKGCVGMTVTYVNRDGTDTKPMLYLGAGAWLLNAERRVREPTRITCKSLLNGTVSFNGVP